MPDRDPARPRPNPELVRRILAGAGPVPPAAAPAPPVPPSTETEAAGPPLAAPSFTAGVGAGDPTLPSPAAEAPGLGTPAADPAAIRAQAAALHQQAIADIQAGDFAAAQARLEQSLALERAIAVPADLAATLVMLGQLRFRADEREAGLALARESLALLAGQGAPEAARVQEIVTQMESLLRQDAPGGSRDLLRQGIATLQAGDGQRAGELLEASLHSAVEYGDGEVAAGALHHLGLLLFSAGHLAEAEAAVRDAVELNRTLEDEHSLAAGLALLGQVLVARGDRAGGLRLLRESLFTWNALGLPAEAQAIKALIAELKRDA